jgi:O-antigen ligase
MKTTPSIPLSTVGFVPSTISVGKDAANPSVFSNIASVCWLATVFIIYSRFFDLVLRGLFIPRVVLSLTLLFFVVSGRPLLFLRSIAGKLMLAMAFWTTFTLIFSVWKSGSRFSYTELLQSLVFFAIAAGLPNSVVGVGKSLYALALSGLLAALMSILFGALPNGRLALRDGSYSDPNYYALALLAVVPFFWQMAASTKSKIIKAFAWLSMAPLFLTISKTGSRGAMVGLVVMVLLLLIISPLKTKIALVLASALGLGTVIATVPSYLRARYFTLFSVDSAAARQSDGGNPDLDRLHSDVGSSEGRKLLLMESIALTLEHPLVGVGPGNFPTAVFEEAKAKGITHNEWMVTHNSYTQISSETGLPGLILLVCLIGVSFNNVRAVLRRAKPTGEKPDVAAYTAAKSLLLSMAAVCTCIFFLAVGYEFTIYVWAGLTVSLRRVYEQSEVTHGALDGVQDLANSTPALAPAYAKVTERSTPRHMPKDSGRSVRFNRFR